MGTPELPTTPAEGRGHQVVFENDGADIVRSKNGKGPEPLRFRASYLVAGARFELATFGS